AATTICLAFADLRAARIVAAVAAILALLSATFALQTRLSSRALGAAVAAALLSMVALGTTLAVPGALVEGRRPHHPLTEPPQTAAPVRLGLLTTCPMFQRGGRSIARTGFHGALRRRRLTLEAPI